MVPLGLPAVRSGIGMEVAKIGRKGERRCTRSLAGLLQHTRWLQKDKHPLARYVCCRLAPKRWHWERRQVSCADLHRLGHTKRLYQVLFVR